MELFVKVHRNMQRFDVPVIQILGAVCMLRIMVRSLAWLYVFLGGTLRTFGQLLC
jgi:hypothetical protein